VPLKIRGALNQETSTYAYTDLTAGTPFTLVLTPGQETEVTIVVNRATMSGPPGALYGSLLRITDSLNYSKIDLGVSAVASDYTGVWAGAVALSQVDQIVGNAVPPAPEAAQATATFAAGAVTGVTVNSSAAQFSSTPTVVFTGGGGTGAAATAVIEKTFLTRVTLTAGGAAWTVNQWTGRMLFIAGYSSGTASAGAGTTLTDGALRSNGGRVLCVTALGDSVKVAQSRAYEAIAGIRFDGMQYRRDIGHLAINRKRRGDQS
jgi:hypothetical protein